MTLKRIILAGLFSLFATSAFAVCPNPVTSKDAAGTNQNFTTVPDASGNCESVSAIVDGAGTTKAAVKAASTPASQTDPGFVVRDADIGTPGDTACTTDTASCTINALAQRIAQRISSLISVTPAAISNFELETGGNAATTNTNLGAPGATACTTDTASCSVNQLLQRIAQRITSALTATTVTQGPQAASHASPWWAKLTDGTSDVAVKAASISALQTDPALVTRSPDAGATTDTPCTLPSSSTACTLDAILKAIANSVSGPIPAATAPYPIIGGVINGADTYNTVAASVTAQALTGGLGGATGDYLSHCTVTPTSTSPGVVTILDSTTAIISFPGGASSTSNLVPFAIPVGAVSINGAWKITTGANVAVACVGKFH